MKTIIKIFAVVILISCYHFSYTQILFDDSNPELRLQHQKNIMSNTPFIIEGKAIQQKYLANEGLTCTVIQITKILKGNGQIKLGTIKLITAQGGSLEDNKGNVSIETIEDGGPVIRKGQAYIIFGISDPSLLPKPSSLSDTLLSTDNVLTLRVSDFIWFNFKNHDKYSNIPLVNWWGTTFNSTEELYTFLKEKGNLIVQVEMEQPTMPADTTKQQKQK